MGLVIYQYRGIMVYMTKSAVYVTGHGLTMDQLIKTLAYGSVPPLLAPGERWSTEKIHMLWAMMADQAAVLVKVTKTQQSAKHAAQKLRDDIGLDGQFEVRVVDRTRIMLCRKPKLHALPPPPPAWHALYPPSVWMDLDEAQEIFGYSRAYLGQLAKRFGIEEKIWNGAGAKLFRRDQMMLLGERGRKTLKAKAALARRRSSQVQVRYNDPVPRTF